MWIVLFILVLVFISAIVINADKQNRIRQEGHKAHIAKIKNHQLKQELLNNIRYQNKNNIALNFAVKGLIYRDASDISAAKKLNEGDALHLERDENNQYDFFATKVLTSDNHFIGYVDRRVNDKLFWIIKNLECCVVSKVDNQTDIPFIYAEAYFKRESVELMTYEDAKRLLVDYGYSALTSKYYSKELKKFSLENIFYCVDLLKKEHPSMNPNNIYSDFIAPALSKAYDNYDGDDKSHLLVLSVCYKRKRTTKKTITTDEWNEIIDCCDCIK